MFRFRTPQRLSFGIKLPALQHFSCKRPIKRSTTPQSGWNYTIAGMDVGHGTTRSGCNEAAAVQAKSLQYEQGPTAQGIWRLLRTAMILILVFRTRIFSNILEPEPVAPESTGACRPIGRLTPSAPRPPKEPRIRLLLGGAAVVLSRGELESQRPVCPDWDDYRAPRSNFNPLPGKPGRLTTAGS